MSRLLLLLLAVFLVSTAALFAHRALAEATPLAIAAWRLGLASLFFLGWSALQGGGRKDRASGKDGTSGNDRAPQAAPLQRSAWARLALSGLCLALHFLTWFASLQYTPVARATLLVCTTPLWTGLFGLVLKRRGASPAYWLALALAGIGVWLVTKAAAEPPTHTVLLGDTLAVTGGALFAVYLLAVEGLHETVSSRRQVTVAYSVAAVILWLALATQGRVRLHYSPGVWQAMLGMTLGPQIFGHTLLNWSLRHFPSSTVAFAILLEPIMAALLAWELLGQTVTPGQMLGGLLVLAGLGLVIARQAPAERIEDEPVG